MDRTRALAKRSKRGTRSVRQGTLVLSERDRQIFFDALADPQKPNARLRRAFRAAGERANSATGVGRKGRGQA